jgi:hypothetical protein
MTTLERLTADIDAFMLKHDMHPTKFGTLAVGDRAFVFRLSVRKGVRSDTIERVYAFMDNYKPEGKLRPKQAEHAA